MNRDTIDFGIDLGTTNSVISVAEGGEVEVIKNRNEPITPSLVYIDKKGVEQIGKAAANNYARPAAAADVQAEFKREMGTTASREFTAAGKRMTPTELSASVLRELREAAKDRFGTAPSAAVITVPAMFEMPQRDATAQAAKLAGFEYSMLLQEPVAAAIASGFQADVDKVYWLVYDYGGGTFDASIIAVRDGQLTVVKHAGDNYLGGADFDRVIVDEFIAPRLRSEYDLPNLDRLNVASDSGTQARFNLLKVLAEEIKKELGRYERVEFYREEIFEDDGGELIDLEITITRADFEAAISKFVDKSIGITKELISDAQLTAGDIERVLLVGGSTFVPLVQRGVESLGIKIDRSQDPMTVVSKGAAIFASSQRLPKEQRAAAPVESGSARIELEYEPVGKDLIPPVAGKIRLEGVATIDGLTLEISRSDGGWTSGRLPVPSSGVFMADVHLREKGQSSFELKLRDAADESIACSPGSFSITYGMSVGKATLPSGLLIALADGTVHKLLPAGVSLPATSETRVLTTVKALAKGSSDSLRIPILSGDESEAELNLVGTTFVLEGTSLSRDLPEGSAVEVTAEVDASGTSTIAFTIPMLDETFEVSQSSELEHESSDAMWDRLRGIRARLEDLEEKGESAGQSTAVREVRAYRDSDALPEIERLIRLWESGDAVAAGQARNNLVAAAKKVKWLAGRVEWPAMVAEAEETTSDVKRLVHEHGDSEERKILDQILVEVDRAIAAEDPKMLERGTTALGALRFAMVQKDPGFWVGFLQHLNGQKSRMTNQARADQLFNEGVMAMKRDDVESLKSVVRELLGLLPAEVAQRVQSGISSGVM